MSIKNPYEYLKVDCLADVEPVEAQSSWCITSGRDETIAILTSSLPDGSWVYGYSVYWANGRTSVQLPSAALGRFRSQREAKLYTIGFMLIYLNYFREETQADLWRAESSLIQAELF